MRGAIPAILLLGSNINGLGCVSVAILPRFRCYSQKRSRATRSNNTQNSRRIAEVCETHAQ